MDGASILLWHIIWEKGDYKKLTIAIKFNVKWEITLLVLDIWDVTARTPNWYDIIDFSVWLQAAASKSLSKFLKLILKCYFTTFNMGFDIWNWWIHFFDYNQNNYYVYIGRLKTIFVQLHHICYVIIWLFTICVFTYIAELFMQINIFGNCWYGLIFNTHLSNLFP